MVTPFVGRTRELRQIRAALDAGRNVVLTGRFGSGRTTLVRQLAANLPTYRFVFMDASAPQRVIRAALRERRASAGIDDVLADAPLVLVLDDVARVTSPRLRLLREIVRAGHPRLVAIVDRAVSSEDVTRLRAVLNAASLIAVGPLDSRATEQYFAEAVERLGIGWSRDEIRSVARSTLGWPLIMRATLENTVAARRLEEGAAAQQSATRRAEPR